MAAYCVLMRVQFSTFVWTLLSLFLENLNHCHELSCFVKLVFNEWEFSFWFLCGLQHFCCFHHLSVYSSHFLSSALLVLDIDEICWIYQFTDKFYWSEICDTSMRGIANWVAKWCKWEVKLQYCAMIVLK